MRNLSLCSFHLVQKMIGGKKTFRVELDPQYNRVE